MEDLPAITVWENVLLPFTETKRPSLMLFPKPVYLAGISKLLLFPEVKPKSAEFLKQRSFCSEYVKVKIFSKRTPRQGARSR